MVMCWLLFYVVVAGAMRTTKENRATPQVVFQHNIHLAIFISVAAKQIYATVTLAINMYFQLLNKLVLQLNWQVIMALYPYIHIPCRVVLLTK